MAESSRIMGSSLLDKIDRLFACNIGDSVDLPQIVVVGEQSSGKSSVLEGLTGLPFPRNFGLCTRFATQITFRRSTDSQITVSILPGKARDQQDREKLQGWKKSGLVSLDPETFTSIMGEVVQEMGIGKGEGESRRNLSDDILRLEIAGPDQEHFSVIDVPGIFRKPTEGETTMDDIAMVNDMIHTFMANPRSVILTVVPGNGDIALQDILQKAKDIDPKGTRTFGILTKPDLVDKGGEDTVIKLLEGEAHKLRLGWHLLRNPGQAELTSASEDRNAIENRFFEHERPWNQLDKEKVGIAALRNKLQEILGDHIRHEFPKVKSDISQKLKTAEADIRALGPKRGSQTEHNQYLMQFALDFQRIVSLAINSEYSRADILNKDKGFRIATEAVSRGQKFADDMAVYGNTHSFLAKDKAVEVDKETVVDIRTMEDLPDIQNIVYEKRSMKSLRNSDILAWLKDEYRSSRGFELGTFDASLLATIMKQQATNWRDLALGYISDIVSLVHTFIFGVLESMSPSVRVFQGVKTCIADHIARMYDAAMKQTNFLLSIELDGTPATYNHYFNENLEKCRQDRLHEQLEQYSVDNYSLGKVIKLNDFKKIPVQSNEDHIVMEIHDILRSYYKVARKRFVDCVRMQVADTLLVTGQDTPLTLFSPKFVTSMSPKTLEDIAGEDVSVKRRRDELEKLIEQLQTGKSIIG